MYLENNEKKYLFQVYTMEIDEFYPTTSQGLIPIYEF